MAPQITREPKFKEQLSELVDLERDAVRAYDRALSRIDLEEARQRFLSFREDHERHLKELGELLGMGKAAAVMRMVYSSTAGNQDSSERDSLRMVHDQECEMVQAYQKSGHWEIANLGELSEEVEEILQRCRADERRHLEYIERILQELPPKQAA